MTFTSSPPSTMLCATTDHSFFSSPPRHATHTLPCPPHVRTRVVKRVVASPTPSTSSPARASKSTPASPLSTPPTSSPISSPTRKRKSPAADAAAAPDAPLGAHAEPAAVPRQVKKLRGDKEKPRRRAVPSAKAARRAASENTSARSTPEPIYRSARSRSGSYFSVETGLAPQRRSWSAEADAGDDPHHFSSEDAVALLLRTYCGYFKNPDDLADTSFKPHPTNYPVVELEYPNSNAAERSSMLQSMHKDHYNPIMDVEQSLYMIVDRYLTPSQQKLFGPVPKGSHFTWEESPSPIPSTSSDVSDDEDHPMLETAPGRLPLLRQVQRAIHMRNGPMFLQAFHDINKILRRFKYPALPRTNSLMQMVTKWTDAGLPKQVLMRVIEENYQRSVGPHVQKLKHYEAFSSAVYGELLPSLVYDIVVATGLKENSLFLDLGSGVGNVVAQASLQSGCRSYGIELNPTPAKVARDMAEHFRVRCRMWGLRLGEIELEEGDMLKSARVNELISQADVVLVDNKVFEQSLNEQLRPKFLDLKEGAYVVSLAPFVPSVNARLTERNASASRLVDDISAIFDVTEMEYHSGSVSWGNSGGTYYIHRVDREGYAEILKRFESSRGGARPARRRA
ncbi:unnamed protein product [Mycena citricolor]|uniref:Histone-lysine N-methyltransferase, H3 lysine-79 specific n=1 Tax=Mycena citricolor TaxID=2018698 RepID=A0AAD2GZQ3_9AGAR|nr:unnamed protein product [Mycena citricolor]